MPDAHAGEEWRSMDGGAPGRAPASSDAVVARAKARIREIRTRDVELRLLDRQGRPVPNTEVEIVQTRNAFPFGCNLWELDTLVRFGEQELDRAAAWRRRFVEAFNAANALCYWTERPRNDAAKTEDIQGRPRLESFAWCVEWAAAQGLTVKGHPLFWSIPKCVPEWVQRYDCATQMKFAEVRVRSLVARFRGQVTLWDAVNEPLWEAAPKNLPRRQWPHLEPVRDIADYVADYLTCAYGHPAVEGFFFWGFMGDAIRWGERSSHEPRPVFERVRDLVKKDWMTREQVASDAEGLVRFRGFHGDYVVRRPTAGGTPVGIRFTVGPEDAMPLSLRLTP